MKNWGIKMAMQYRLLFPFEKIQSGSRILLYGAGHTGKHYLKQILMTKYCQIIGVIDKNYEDYQSYAVPVYPLEKVPFLDFDYVVISMQTSTYNKEIISSLRDLGVADEKIIYVGQRKDVSYQKEQEEDVGIFERDFSLESGERATAKTLDGIRRDHILRYKMAGEFLLKTFSPPRETMGIDCFCGTGYGSRIIAEILPQSQIVSVDGSEESVMFGNRYFHHESVWRTSKIWPFRLPRETFDFAVAFESVEHVPDGERFIEALVDSLKPGGYFFCSVPNARINSLELNQDLFHCKHWKSQELESVLLKSMKILGKYGQEIFFFEHGIKAGLRSPEDMVLRENCEGAVLVYVCRKR